MNNKNLEICTNCEENYCKECTDYENWNEFCSKECDEEYDKAQLNEESKIIE